MREEFDRWLLHADPERSEQMVRVYNEALNC